MSLSAENVEAQVMYPCHCGTVVIKEGGGGNWHAYTQDNFSGALEIELDLQWCQWLIKLLELQEWCQLHSLLVLTEG